MFSKYWGGVLLTLPFFIRFQSYVDPRIAQDLFFIVVSFVSLALFGGSQANKSSRAIVLYFLVLAGLNQFEYTSGIVLLQWVELSLGILILLQMKNLGLDFEIISRALVISMVIQCFWLLLNYFGHEPYYYALNTFGSYGVINQQKVSVVIGSLGQATLSGAHIALCIPACIYLRRFYLVGIALFCIALSGSAMSMLTALCCLWFIFASKYIKSRILVLTAPFIGVVLIYIIGRFFTIEYLGDTRRFVVWEQTLRLISGWDVIFGKGLGYFSENFSKYYKHEAVFKHPHNEFLEVYISFGVVGLLGVLKLIKDAFKSNNTIYCSMFFGVVVNSFGNLTFHVATTALIGIIVYSLIIKER